MAAKAVAVETAVTADTMVAVDTIIATETAMPKTEATVVEPAAMRAAERMAAMAVAVTVAAKEVVDVDARLPDGRRTSGAAGSRHKQTTARRRA